MTLRLWHVALGLTVVLCCNASALAQETTADVTGTWKHPLLNGALVVHDGELSLEPLGAVHLTALEANVGFHGDSIAGRVTARSGKTKPSTGELSGFVGIRDLAKPVYGLKLVADKR